MKLCKDCKHYIAPNYVGMGYVFDAYVPGKCRYPGVLTLNLENGTMMFRDNAHSGEPLRLRKDQNACGVDGKWFEQRSKE